MATETATKQPWQMTQKEYAQYMSDTFEPIFHGQIVGKRVRWRGTSEQAIAKQKADVLRAVPEHHRYSIRQALKEGKSVPPEVLKDYPELQPATSPKPAKELWQMTRGEYINQAKELRQRTGLGKNLIPEGKSLTEVDAGMGRFHKRAVESALSEGKPVPAEVLKDYPELGRKEEASDIEKGDFIQMKGEIGKGLHAPRGFVVGEGTVGKIPAWKIKQANDSITLIPKDDAVALGKPPRAFAEPTPKPEPKAEGREETARFTQLVHQLNNQERLAKGRGHGFGEQARAKTKKALNREQWRLEQIGIGTDYMANGYPSPTIKIWEIAKPKAEAKPQKETKPEPAIPKPTETRPGMILREGKPRLTKQSDRALAIDRSLLAKQVVTVEDPRWLKRPNRFDVRGIDTPGRGRIVKGVAYADRGKQRLSRRHHRGFKRIKFT